MSTSAKAVLALLLAGCGGANYSETIVYLSTDAGRVGVIAPEPDASPAPPDTPVPPGDPDVDGGATTVDGATPVDADLADAADSALLYDGSDDARCFFKYGAAACGWSWCAPTGTDAAFVPCSGTEAVMGGGGGGEPQIECCRESDAGEGGASP